MNIAKHLDRSAFFFPHRPAVSHGEFDITYRDLDRMANRIAGGLTGLGMMPGDLVGLCAPNSVEWIAFYFGVLKAGGVAVTYSSSLQNEELQLLLDHSRPRFLMTVDSKLDQIGIFKIGPASKRLFPKPDRFLLAALSIAARTRSEL